MSRSHESFVSWIIASEPVQRVNGEDVNRKQVSVFSEGLFPFVTHTHTPSGKADKMGNMSCRISLFKINGHDLLACSSVAMKSNNLQGPNENKYSANVVTCVEFLFPFLMDF